MAKEKEKVNECSSELICLSCGEQFQHKTANEHFLAYAEKDSQVFDIDNIKVPLPCPKCNLTRIKYNH